MVASPLWFFSKVEQILFSDEDNDTVVKFVPPDTIIQEENMETLDREIQVLNNLNKMIASTNGSIKQMWTIKKLEFERELRWRRMDA
jgi:hypothetical protein